MVSLPYLLTFLAIAASLFACQLDRQPLERMPIQQVAQDDQEEAIHAIKVISQEPKEDQISQVVRVIFQDQGGTLWFGTQNGAFHVRDSVLVHIDDIVDVHAQGVTIKDIAEANDGTIWLGHTGGLTSIKGNSVRNYYESDGLISHDVWSVTTDQQGHVWIGSIAGAQRFNGESFERIDLPVGRVDTTLGISSAEMVHHIMEDSDGRMWFSTNAGLFAYEEGQLSNKSEEWGIPTNFINRVLQDSKGDFWISTKKGLYHRKDGALKHVRVDGAQDGKGCGMIVENKDGSIVFVENQHHLYRYDGKNLKDISLLLADRELVVFEGYLDQSDRLWLVGFGGAYRMQGDTLFNVSKNGPW